jgi:hypothetical protein
MVVRSARLAALCLCLPLLLCPRGGRADPRQRVELRIGPKRLRLTGPISELGPKAIVAALGKPSRTVRLKSKQRYERFGIPGKSAPQSTMVEVTNFHHVYDELGLVFSTENGRFADTDTTPRRLYVVYRALKTGWHDDPAVLPARKFAGVLRINGQALDPARDPTPKGVTYQTDSFPLFGTKCSTSSRATQIDSIYCYDLSPTLRIFLDVANRSSVGFVLLR